MPNPGFEPPLQMCIFAHQTCKGHIRTLPVKFVQCHRKTSGDKSDVPLSKSNFPPCKFGFPPSNLNFPLRQFKFALRYFELPPGKMDFPGELINLATAGKASKRKDT
jgi:hypothetical protein